MKKISLSEYNSQTKALWFAMLAVSLFTLGFAVFEAISYSVSEFAVLGVSLFISFIVNQYSVNIPGTQTKFSIKELMVFWGVIWLGIPGGILLSLSGTLAQFDAKARNISNQIFKVFSNLAATLAAANLFYFFLQNKAGFSKHLVGDAPIETVFLISAICLTALTHYIVNALVYSTFLSLQGDYTIREILKENTVWKLVGCVLLTLATVFLHFVFIYFGIAFGLVLLFITITGHLGCQFHNRRLAQKTKEISEASRVHLATVEALATAIDARDQVGIGHVRRVQIYATGIGKVLNLSENEIDALRTGALLHDIGKLAVPDHILNKPGRLTPAETEKTKVHASVGAAILEKIGFACPVVPTVKYHHERWDGSGYPDRLQGTEIPLTARILAVADTYDTLRGARPYRAAISRDESRKILLNDAGKQFDPQIIDVFLRNLRRFEIEVEEQGFSYTLGVNEKPENQILSQIRGENSYVDQIKRANREVFTLYELAREFSSSLNSQETLELFARKIADFVPFDTCTIYLLDETNNAAKIVYAEGKNQKILKNKRIKVGDGATGYVLEKRQPVQNINPKLDFPPAQFNFAEEYTAMASLPLITDEKLIGAVSIYSCELLGYQEEHLRLLETVTRIAADAIVKSIQHTETETRALTDPMTGLPNARSLQVHFEKEVARASRSGNSFQVLMLDLDGFKAVNDTFGHKAGDAMLKGISAVMSEQLRDYDFLARYAGDEFVAIVPETDEEAVRDLCRRIEEAVIGFKLPVGDDKFASVGVSLGAASYPRHGESFDQVVIAADKAMYVMKGIRKQRRLKEAENKTLLAKPPVQPPITATVIETRIIPPTPNNYRPLENRPIPEMADEGFIVELDESHIVSSAIN